MINLFDPSKIVTTIQICAALLVVILILFYILANLLVKIKNEDFEKWKRYDKILRIVTFVIVFIISILIFVFVKNEGFTNSNKNEILNRNFNEATFNWLTTNEVNNYTVHEIRKIVESTPDLINMRLYAAILNKEGKTRKAAYSESIKICKEILEKYKTDKYVFFLLGEAEYSLGQLDESIRAYKNVLNMNSKDVNEEYLNAIANYSISLNFTKIVQLNNNQKLLDSASIYLNKSKDVLSSKPETAGNIEAQQALIYTLRQDVKVKKMALVKYKEAIILFERKQLKESDPTLLRTYNDYASSLNDNKQFSDALQIQMKTKDAMELTPDKYKNDLPYVYCTIGESYTGLKKNKEACVYYQKSLEGFIIIDDKDHKLLLQSKLNTFCKELSQ